MSNITPAELRAAAERLAEGTLPLLTQLTRPVTANFTGSHDLRNAGSGENFWQYRHAIAGDSAHMIDWRQSARSDSLFVRQTEWETARITWLWCDNSASMHYRSQKTLPSKYERASLLIFTLALLLNREGERLALLGGEDLSRPGRGERWLDMLASTLCAPKTDAADYGQAPPQELSAGTAAILASDFLGPQQEYMPSLERYAESGATGVIFMILDPTEEIFPFTGRVLFRSMNRQTQHEAQRAEKLQKTYRQKLANRKNMLKTFARECGWYFIAHQTSERPQSILAWIHNSLRADK